MKRNKPPPLKKKVSIATQRQSLSKNAPGRSLATKTSILKLYQPGQQELNELGIDESESWRGKILQKPPNQVTLTADELNEEIARMLTSTNMKTSLNLVEYSYEERQYVPAPHTGNIVELMAMEALCFHKDSEEARSQMVIEASQSASDSLDLKVEQSASGDQQIDEVIEDKVGEEEQENQDGTEKEKQEEEDASAAPENDRGSGEEKTDDEPPDAPEDFEDTEESDGKRMSIGINTQTFKTAKKILNQFNFYNEAALTYNEHIRDSCLQTEPTQRATLSGYVTQYIIFDAYEEDFAETQRQKAKEHEKFERVEHKHVSLVKLSVFKEQKSSDELAAYIMQQALNITKMTERIINQNTYDEIAQACRYWDDPSDEFHDTGSLLPLWKFTYEKTKTHMVTSLCWNPCYHDLFAATFGSFDIRNQTQNGALCMFTLKNPSYPEYVCFSDSGMMCVDIHSSFPQLFVVGMYNGDVSVYDMMQPVKEPQHKSDIKTRKHTGVVTQVKWNQNAEEDVLSFYSIGGDGCVFLWTIMKYYLVKTKIITLDFPLPPIVGPDGTHMKMTAYGTSFAFHPTDPLIFLVGTQEGAIFKCNTAYCSSPLSVNHKAHSMAVNKIQYNPYYNDIYISCSPDWRIKIWEDNREAPLFVFEMGTSVMDVEWSPYSSTVFTAATADGRVFVFDISLSIYEPICVECDITRRKLQRFTKIAFNQKLPFFIIGNNRGRISSLKFSPNLRRKIKPPKKGPVFTTFELEVAKLEKALIHVREPPVFIVST